MILFLVGLELEPQALWAMRKKLLSFGGIQVGITTFLIAFIAFSYGFK